MKYCIIKKIRIISYLKIQYFSYESGGQQDGYYEEKKVETKHYPILMINKKKIYEDIKNYLLKGCTMRIFNLKEELMMEFNWKDEDCQLNLYNPNFIDFPSEDKCVMKFIPQLKKKNIIVEIYEKEKNK